MYRLISFHPAHVAKDVITRFNPLDHHEYPMMTFDEPPTVIPEREAMRAQNAVRFGPNASQELTPPNIMVLYNETEPVSLTIGRDIFNKEPITIDVSGANLSSINDIAKAHINMLSKVNAMLERTPEEYRERVTLNSPGVKSVLAVACAQTDTEKWLHAGSLYPSEMNLNTFSNNVLHTALTKMSERMSAYGVQELASKFVPTFYEEMPRGTGTLQENASRALVLAATSMIMRDIPSKDEAVLSEMIRTMNSKRHNGIVESMWNQRQNDLWRLWQVPDSVMPQRHQATFKTAFVQQMSEYLGEYNFPGDESMIWTAGYEAAYRAGEAALRVDEPHVTYEYLALQKFCIDRLNELREAENDKDATHHERDRGYQTYDEDAEPSWEPTDIEPI